MTVFILQLTSNDSTFEYSFSQGFLCKKLKIGVIKLDGYLEIKSKINKNDQSNNAEKNNTSSSNTIDSIFITCNLIEDCYVNEKIFNSIYGFRPNDEIEIEPKNIIYHEVTNRPNKINLKLVDINNYLIDFKNINIFIELVKFEFLCLRSYNLIIKEFHPK